MTSKTSFETLSFRLKVEEFLLSIARKFIYITPSEINKEIHYNLKRIAQFTEADRCYIYFFREQNTKLELISRYYTRPAKEKIAQHDQVQSPDFAWFIRPIVDGTCLEVSNQGQLPPNAGTIKMIMEVEETKSMLVCPIQSGKSVIGFIGLDSVGEERAWPDSFRHLLKASADIFNGALERKKAVKSGIRTEQKLRSLFTGIEDVVFISNPEGKILEINPAGARLLGFSSVKELVNIHNIENFYANPKDRALYKKTIIANGHVKDYEINLRRKDGKLITVLETAVAVKNHKGEVVAYEGIVRDITEKRQLELQLAQAQKMESIGLLAGGIAHDFNNILTALTGYAQLILMSGDESQSYYKNAENILRSGKRAEELVRQLLAFSRNQTIELAVTDINTVITDLYSMLSRLVKEDIEFVLDLKHGIDLVKADIVQIQQILTNLVVNAGHAIDAVKSESRPKKIIISTSQTKLTADFVDKHPGSSKGNHILLSVKDSGVGMDEETARKIFEPFFTTKKGMGGTGLGLSTIYGIVKQNRGYIHVKSKHGKGTRFDVYWPTTSEDKRKTTRPENGLPSASHDETILFVEDNEDVRELACTSLKSLGYTVIEAQNGVEALNIVAKKNLINEIDILVSDMVMPEMGGEELARSIVSQNSDIKILLCSGYTDSRIFQLETENQFQFAFLAKPYTINKLDEKIRKVLANKE